LPNSSMPTKKWPRKRQNNFEIGELIKTAGKKLGSRSDSPFLDAEVLLAATLKKSRSFLSANPEKKLEPKKAGAFLRNVNRRYSGTPIAYLTGEKEFFGRKFIINERVLVPRPETETLVEMALEKIRNGNSVGTKILDVGTGSGCIAITLDKELGAGGKTIVAADISPGALAVAKKNAKKLGTKIRFVESDLFTNLPGRFDYVLANLPYVPAKDWRKNMLNLKKEPKIALTDGTDDWQLIEKFLEQLPRHLAKNGAAFLEIDPLARKKIAGWIKKSMPKASSAYLRDLSGRLRYVTIQT
jgi:release factor glutamine methyltransferase